MTDLFPPSIAIKATQCITTTVTTGENTAYSYELNYNGLWKTFIASFSKFNAEECLILVQEAKAPSSNRKRAAGKFRFSTFQISTSGFSLRNFNNCFFGTMKNFDTRILISDNSSMFLRLYPEIPLTEIFLRSFLIHNIHNRAKRKTIKKKR